VIKKWNARATPAVGGEDADVRWAVNVLLEKIAEKFEGWDTFDLFRPEAAAIVRSFKYDIAAPPASPLRGRTAIRQILHDHFRTGEPGELDAIESATNILASPPEQPSAECGDPNCKDPDYTYGKGTDYLAQPDTSMLADIAQIINDGWKSGKPPADVAAEVLREFQ